MSKRYRKAAVWQAILSTLGYVREGSKFVARRLRGEERFSPFEPLEPRRMLSTYVVNSVADSSATGTLRWAVGQTNTHAGGTIDFDSSISGQTINLSLGALNISVPQNTYINGPTITINGDGGQIFHVEPGANATINGLTMTNGYSSTNGGAIDNQGTLKLTHSAVSYSGAYAYGGAIFNDYYTNLTVTDCNFDNNFAGSHGGAIANVGNESYGGSNATITNSAFANNHITVSGDGGAIYYGDYSYGSVNDCTFTQNSAPSGGAIADDFGSAGTSFVQVSNSILWNDSNDELEVSTQGDGGGGVSIEFSDVEGGLTSSDILSVGSGMINADPQFVGATGNLQLQPTSPCVDTGKNADVPSGITTDLAGNPRIVASIVDMGAYECQNPIIYVDHLATSGANNGSSWTNAFLTLQSALSVATSGVTIEVGQGTYFPTTGTSRTATFQLKNGVTIDGGFAGTGTSVPDARDPVSFPTILSGNIGSGSSHLDNSFHVVTGSGTNSTALLDGFTITQGEANGSGTQVTGGGIFDSSGSPTINDCIITGNFGTDGAGIANTGSTSAPSITNDTISFNAATSLGGGMYDSSSKPNVSNSTFDTNSAVDGGGVYNSGSPSATTFSGCTFTNNTASDSGGGMYNNAGSPTITNCTFTSNSASSDGGGIYNNGSTAHITGGSFNNNTAGRGGGVFNLRSAVTMSSVGFNSNQAGFSGGGIANYGVASPTLSDLNFNGNTAEFGGAIANFGFNSGNIINSSFSNDTVTNWGGGIYNNQSSPTITGSTFNSEHAAGGGAIYNDFDSSPRITTSTFTNCTVTGDGGAITTNGLYYGCTGYYSGSGGVYSTNDTPTIQSCTFQGDSAGFQGGAIYNTYATVSITYSSFDSNSAGHGGAAIRNGSYSLDDLGGTSVNVTDCIFTNNSVTVHGDGGGILNGNYAYTTVSDSTFTQNSATSGGAVADDFGSSNGTSFVHVNNSILWNDSPNEVEASGLDFGGTPAIVVQYSDVEGGVPTSSLISSGSGNINADPLFNGPTSDLTLEFMPNLSPAIDTGNNGLVPGGITKDFAGHTRIVGTVDMGAYEFQSKIIYVDHTSTSGANNGSSWPNAYLTLQSGLAAAVSGNIILVGQGTYFPTATTSRTATFQLKNGVSVYGGYDGFGTATPGNRNVTSFVTILSGNIGSLSTNTDNSFHVVTGSGTNSTALLDGFTVTLGEANGGSSQSMGGGLYDSAGSPTINECTITHNYGIFGGGVANVSSSSPIFTNSTFSFNTAADDGGGMYDVSSSPTLSNCAFTSNTGGDVGGGMYNSSSSPNLTNCTFTNNGGVYEGGGMYNASSSPTLNNCTFTTNTASEYGGGMFNTNSSPHITGGSFVGNVSDFNGGGMYNDNSSPVLSGVHFTNNNASEEGGGIYNYNNSAPSLSNMTFSGNTAGLGGAIANITGSSPTIADSSFTNDSASNGGGIYDDGGSPTITGSTFTHETGSVGGAIDNFAHSSPKITTSTFTDCTVTGDGGAIANNGLYYSCAGYGGCGGMYSTNDSPTIQSCTFEGDSANIQGGAIYSTYSTVSISYSTFEGNTAHSGGGAIANHGGAYSGAYGGTHTTITDSLFVGNKVTVSGDGGAILNGRYCYSTVSDSTFTANSVTGTGSGGGAIADDFGSPGTSLVQVNNSILWNDGSTELKASGSGTTPVINVQYTDIEGGVPASLLISSGSGNINADPQFIRNPNLGISDFGDEDLQISSPAINVGNNSLIPSGITADLAGGSRIVADVVDMGAFENQNVTAIYVDQAATSGANDGTSWTDAFTDLQNGFTAAQNIEVNDPTERVFMFVGQGTYLPGSEGTAGGTSLGTVETVSGDVPGVPIPPTTASGIGTDGIYHNLNAAIVITINADSSVSITVPVNPITHVPYGTYNDGDDIAVDVINNSPHSVSSINLSSSSAADIFGFNGDGVSTVLPEPTGIEGYEGPDNFFSNIVSGPLTDTGTVNFTDTDCGLPAGGKTYFSLQEDTDLSGALSSVGANVPKTFQLINNVSVMGGYSGTGTTNPYLRNIPLFQTILSGNVDPDHDGCVTCYHVVTGSGTNSTAVLDGVTVTQGNANGTGANQNIGAGLFNNTGSPTINNVTFVSNTATNGGAVANINTSAPTLTNETFNANTASNDGGGIYSVNSSPLVNHSTFVGDTAANGGGVFDDFNSSPTIENSTFVQCSVSGDGGAIDNLGAYTYHCAGGGMVVEDFNDSPTIAGNTFDSNTAGNQGGAIYSSYSTVTVIDGVFDGDSAHNGGGAIAFNIPNNYGYSNHFTITNSSFVGDKVTVGGDGGAILNGMYSYGAVENCTFTKNSASSGGAIAEDFNSAGTAFIQVANSVLWSDSSNEVEVSGGGSITAMEIEYTDIQGGVPSDPLITAGSGDLNSDPKFVRTPNLTATVKDYGDMELQSISPVINHGHNADVPSGVTTDLAGNARIVNTTVDMGAYERQTSSVPSANSITVTRNGSGKVTSITVNLSTAAALSTVTLYSPTGAVLSTTSTSDHQHYTLTFPSLSGGVLTTGVAYGVVVQPATGSSEYFTFTG